MKPERKRKMDEINSKDAKISSGSSCSFTIEDLDCPDCAAKVERNVAEMPGVKQARMDFMRLRLSVEFEGKADREAVQQKVKSLGHRALPVTKDVSSGIKRTQLLLCVISGILVAAGMVFHHTGSPDAVTIPLFLMAMVTGGYYVVRKALIAVRNVSLDMNFLMTVAVIGAGILGEWNEGAMVIFLFAVANLLESYSLDKARNSIRKLMDMSSKKVLVRRNGTEVLMGVDEVEIGEIVIIKPGSNIPLDGEIVSGTSSVNQSAITGESMPVDKAVGDEVYAGTLNQQGALEVRVTKYVADTELQKIIHLVEEAQAQRAPTQNFVDRFARYYTPIVVGIAVLLAAAPPLLFGAPFAVWFYRALVMLVIACPCAMVISTPVTIVSGLARAAWGGVLIKGGVYLENAGKIRCMALDKTGTLTLGQPEVVDVMTFNGVDKRLLLAVAGAMESRSEHPLAAAIVSYAGKAGVEFDPVSDFEALPGKGVKAKVNGREYFLGSHSMFEEMGICDESAHDTLTDIEKSYRTAILVGSREVLFGIFAIADQIRDSASDVVSALKKNGIQHTVMLTGDNRLTAQAIGEQIGIDEIGAELLPEDKVRAVKALREKYQDVAMVGDGVNDAPALAASSMGIAMGAAGTDAALETADVCLMADDLTRLPFLIKLSKKTLRIIKENIAMAIGIKAVFMGLAIPGLATLWMAVFADMGASLLVIFNGLRMLRK